MTKFLRCCALAAVLVPASAQAALAGDLNLTISNGRVTLSAQDVTVRQILAEWERIGQTKIVNGDKLMGPPVTMELRDVPESKALETLLRSAAGYMVTPRLNGRVGMSTFDAVVILPTSRAPIVQASAPPSFNQPRPQPVMPQIDDDDREPQGDQPQQQPMAQPGPLGQQFPGQPTPGPTPTQPQATQPPGGNLRNTPGPMTSPVPGQLPPPPQSPTNPYQPQPGTRPPTRPGGGGGGGEGF
jgi:hypothetical protein